MEAPPKMSLARYIARRVLQAIPTLLILIVFMFILVRILPGDPARLIAGLEATEEDVERIREVLGLNKPLHEQFIDYMSGLLRGDLGTSIKYDRPVLEEILARFPKTLELAIAAELIAIALAIPLGVVSALKPYTKTGLLATIVSLIGSSMPIYWLGLMLIYIFSVQLRLLPSSGTGTLAHLVLPAVTLATLLMGNLVRITRASVLEALESNYIVTARSKGLREEVVVYRHALRNALIPIITITGLQLGALLGGAILTETVFAWPGLGQLLLTAINSRDYPLIQGIIIFYAVILIVINLVIDIAYAYIDPRVRVSLWSSG